MLVAHAAASQGMSQVARETLRRLDGILADNAHPLRSMIGNLDTFTGPLARNSDRPDGIVAGLERLYACILITKTRRLEVSIRSRTCASTRAGHNLNDLLRVAVAAEDERGPDVAQACLDFSGPRQMHATFDTILKQKVSFTVRVQCTAGNASAVQLQCRGQCFECHPLRGKQLIVLKLHSWAEYCRLLVAEELLQEVGVLGLARRLGFPFSIVSFVDRPVLR